MKTRALLSTTLLAALLIYSLSALAADPIQFNLADSYPIAASPFRMTSGDFNKDGWPDLVVVDNNANYSILMNNGAGGFTAANYTISGSQLRDAVVVNLAGDTIPDLVLSDWTGSKIRVLTGVGNGTFTLTASLGLSSNGEGIAAGDFNGDGYPDVAVCLRNANQLNVLLGTSGGGFGAAAPYGTGNCNDLAVGYVNGGTALDLVTANWSSSNISVLLGNGNGTFGTATSYAVGGNATDVALADINHEGNLDAVVAAYSINKAVIMLGNGAGVFTIDQSLSTVRGAQQIRVADFNLDGFLDIATANASAAPGMSLLQATGYNTFMAAATFHPDQAANGLAIADFNRDTGPDVATSHTNNTVRVMKVILPADTDGDGMPDNWENQYVCMNPMVGDSTLDPDNDGLKNFDEFRHSANPCLADTDGDGLNDYDEVNLYHTNPAKTDSDSDLMPDGWEAVHACMLPAVSDAVMDYDSDTYTNLYEYQHATDPCVFNDADSDGMPDGWEILYASCGLNPNVNDAGLDPDADTKTNLQEYLAHTNPCVAEDSDHDGMPDFYEALHPCLNPAVNDADADPDGDLWTNLYEYQHATDPCVAIDTDGDGMPDNWEDMYASCGVNKYVDDAGLDPDGDLLTNLEEYLARTNPCVINGYAVAATPFRMAAGDFNKDGYPDLVVVDDTNSFTILMNNGSGAFTATNYAAGGDLRDAAVVNLAGDTIPDLVLSDYSGYLRVFTGAGNGTFTLSASIALSSSGDGIAAGDFNGDGYPDVAVCLRAALKVGVLLGTSGGSFGAVTTYTTSAACDDLAVGLINGDGYQDIVTANWTSDNISVLLGNGNGTFGTPANITVGNDNTDVALADIDHDGKLDAVVAAYASNAVVIMVGDGAGGFTLSQSLPVNAGPNQVRVADFNLDGFLDIATANSSAAPGLSILLATGFNVFMAAAPFHSDQAVNGLAIADFNRDTGLDIATSHPGNNTVRVILNRFLDTDGDGMLDWWENQYACMNPLVGDSTLDPDNDGLNNIDEYRHGANPCVADTDGDGLNDGTEVNTYHTDPINADSDGDVMPDGWEAAHACLNPPVADAILDPDHDGWTNLYEYQHSFDPCRFNDADADGMPDSYELAFPCLHINVADGEVDYDSDGMNSLEEFRHSPQLNPCNPDTDADGLPDGWEVQNQACGFDPLSYWSEIVGKIGSDLQVTSDPSGSEAPSLVWTGSEFGVSWIDSRDGNRVRWEIYFARVSAAGEKIGDDLRITNDQNDSFAPSLSWSGSEFGVSWDDTRNGNDELYFARISAAGSKIGSDLRVTYAPGDSSFSSLIWTGSEFGVSWNDYRNDGVTEIYFARISAAGSKIGADFRVTSDPSLSYDPSLSWTGSEFGISWHDQRGGQPKIYFARVSPAGSKIGADIPVAGAPLVPPSLSWTGSEFGLAWGGGFTRLTADGNPIGSPVSVGGDNPSLSWTGSEFGVSWDDHRDGNWEVYFARVSATGSKIGADLRVTSDLRYSDSSSLSWTGSEFGVSWMDTRIGNYKIYFARISGGFPDTDKDGDGLREDQEYALGTNPCNPDSDGDGLTDGYEANTSHTNPMNWDTDADRLPDKFEVDNAAHAGGGLDPNNAFDATTDFDGDGNSNANEYWNGSDPWLKDPVPGTYAKVGCYYWADGDGDGIPAPSDIIMLKLEIAGSAQEYRFILPHGIDTLDLDRDGYTAPADLIALKMMVAGSERPGGYDSQANALEVVSAPSGSVAAGTTTHVTVSVHSVGGTVAYAPGFGVVFEVVSGNGVLLGGDGTADGEAARNRYDISMEAALGARANVVVLVTGPGAITIGAKVPGCGTKPNGRWNDEVVLSGGVVINGE